MNHLYLESYFFPSKHRNLKLLKLWFASTQAIRLQIIWHSQLLWGSRDLIVLFWCVCCCFYFFRIFVDFYSEQNVSSLSSKSSVIWHANFSWSSEPINLPAFQDFFLTPAEGQKRSNSPIARGFLDNYIPCCIAYETFHSELLSPW